MKPDLVAQVRFTEWTDDRKLRHPVYLGLRTTSARAVEMEVPVKSSTSKTRAKHGRGACARDIANVWRHARAQDRYPVQRRERRGHRAAAALEDARKDGTIQLPGGHRLGVSNLAKLFWPKLKLTKGDLLRYYAAVSPFALPAVADRPLVMKRFNGIDGIAFYQQKKVKEQPPPGVRVEVLAEGSTRCRRPEARRFVGGNLITLLYMTQLAAISQDPWFSRVQSPLDADYVALDLDPGDDTAFAKVLDVARWVRDELDSLKVAAVPKTSRASGLHVYPAAARTLRASRDSSSARSSRP